MHISPIRLKLVPVAIAALLGGLSATAFATPVSYGTDLSTGLITLDAEYRLPQNALTTENGMDTTTGASIYSTTSGADMYRYTTGPNASNVFFHTYGFTANPTYFGARTSGEGSFYASTYARYSQTFTNNTLLDQIYNFAFNVADGEVAITGAGKGFASLMLRVNVTTNGGTTTWAQSSTRLDQEIGGARTCAESDSGSLAGYLACDSGNNMYNSGGQYNVNLGSFAPNQEFRLDYDIIATVSGDLSYSDGYGGEGWSMGFTACGNPPAARGFKQAGVEDENGGEGGGNGEENPFVCNGTFSFPGMAIARSGDPFNGPNFASSNGDSDNQTAGFRVTSANAVPEPGSLALLGAAVAALAAVRRKKPAIDTAA